MTYRDQDKKLSHALQIFKSSSISSIIFEFSTRQPTQDSLKCIFKILGLELKNISRADKVYHLFSNPSMNEAHIIDCISDDTYTHKKDINIYIEMDTNPFKWFYLSSGSINPSEDINYQIESTTKFPDLWNLIDRPPFFAIAPFCNHGVPLGFFILVWKNDKETPNLFKEDSKYFREGISNNLNYIQIFSSKLFKNHFLLHYHTYLPSYMRSGQKRVAVLFADIRNFTESFESLRLHRDSPNPMVGFVKAYLDAASLIIAQPGIGSIDKFLGDGIMATFGEYILCGPSVNKSWEENIEIASCLLAIYSASMLYDSFQKLFNHLLKTDIIEEFMKEFNERLDLRIGIGINFGEVVFDYFGTSLSTNDRSSIIGGYLEYTAIGDNVNTAQRLESIASKPLTDVSIIQRSKYLYDYDHLKDHTAPIIISRTIFLRTQGIFKRPNNAEMLSNYYKSVVSLKGKGGIAEVFEIHPDHIQWDSLTAMLNETRPQKAGQQDSIEKYFNHIERKFEFPETLAKELFNRYYNYKV
jgi:class 3 adenylate cyclase